MILPRCNSWLHTVPANVAWQCHGAPPWFTAALEHAAPAERPLRGLVAWGASAAAIAAADADLLVLVNAPRARADRLTAGFRHVRRYAVLPNLREARWFIPLANPRVAAAGFCLYTPQRFAARAVTAAAHLAARAGVPGWYRHSITLASNAPGELTDCLSRLFPQENCHLAISTGAPGPDSRRKPSMAVLAPDGTRLAFVKVAGSPVAHAMLAHEAAVLPRLQQPGRAAIGPRLLFAGEINGAFITVQSPIEGRPVPPILSPQHHALLECLRGPAGKPAAATQMVAQLRQAVRTLALPGVDAPAAIAAVLPTLETTPVPATIMHADFVPWNLRSTPAGLAAFDWDGAELDGLPLLDAWHHDLIVGHLLRHWPPEKGAAYLLDAAAAAPMNYTQRQVLALEITYVLWWLVRLVGQGHNGKDEMVAWYSAMFQKIMTCYTRLFSPTLHRPPAACVA